MSTLWYGIKQGIKSIIQNKAFSLAAIGTITACLFLLGVFYSLFSNFQHMVYNAESTVGITVFFNEGITSAQIEEIGTKISACHAVEQVKFVSADEAWKKFQKNMLNNDPNLATTFGTDNPLKGSESYEVYLKDVSQQEAIVNFITKLDGVRKVNGSETVAKNLKSFNMLTSYVTVTIIVLMILVSIFLINTAVDMGINVRKDEIAIMKLIGATDLFVRLPFLIEGIVMGLIGAIIPIILLRIIYQKVIGFIATHFSMLSDWLTFLSAKQIFQTLIPLSLIVGMSIGLVGSAFSVRKHLNI